MRTRLLVLALLASTGCKRTAASAPAATEQPLTTLPLLCPAVLEATRAGGLDEDRYVAPNEVERRALREAISLLVRGGPDSVARASASAATASFEIVDVPSHSAVLLRERGRKRGGGAYLVRPGMTSRLAIQAPHTFFDEGTLPLGCELFARARAGALFINTAHRFKSAPQPPAADSPADAAHARDSLYQAATEGLVHARPTRTVVVQLHGFAERDDVPSLVVVSSGSKTPGDPVLARVALALSRVIDGGVLRFPDDHQTLGATTNVQGALVREAGGLFLHVEMAASLRRTLLDNATKRAQVLATLADAVEGA